MAEAQLKVKVSRIFSVAPAIPTAKQSMFLSAIDISKTPSYYVGILLFYKTPVVTAQKDFLTMVEKLKKSLSLVLVDFYPFAGRLDMKGGESGRPQIDCNDEGVEFVEATIDTPFQDAEIDNFQHKHFFRELVQTRHGKEGDAVLSIQVTGFRGGGFCMGVNFNHMIADGNSFSHFMSSWAECSRGIFPISKSPHHMRTVFQRDNGDRAIPNVHLRAEEVVTDLIKEAQIFKFVPDSSLPIKYSEITASTLDGSVENTNNTIIQKYVEEETNLEISTFHFSEKFIQALKERSGALTSFVAVSAQFWRCVMKARQVPENNPVYFRVSIDFRGRVKPPLPPTYFGNCVSSGIARTTGKKLLEEDIVFAAALIQEVIYSCASDAHINNFVDFVESHIGSGNIDPTLGNLCSDYIVTPMMSPKFRVYEIDHGWGKPVSVQAPSLKGIGRMMLFPGTDGGKSIAVSTKLPRHQMETLKQILMVIPE